MVRTNPFMIQPRLERNRQLSIVAKANSRRHPHNHASQPQEVGIRERQNHRQ
jgi:hypothetical protein